MCARPTATTSSIEDLNLEIERGQKTVLVGPNGAGKVHAPQDPRRRHRHPGRHARTRQQTSSPATFAQNRGDNVKLDLTVLENMMELRTQENQLTEQQARAVLGGFPFPEGRRFQKSGRAFRR